MGCHGLRMGMGLGGYFMRHGEIRHWVADLAVLPFLGATAYFLARASASLRPVEAATLMMVAAGLVVLGRRWYGWQRSLAPEGLLSDWASRILRGHRTPLVPPVGLGKEARLVVGAFNVLLGESHRTGVRLESLHQGVIREWAELDALLAQIQQQSSKDRMARATAGERLATYGQELREAMEGSLKFDQIELGQRLRAGQHRFQGQAFRAALEQAQARLVQVETLMKELQDTFPRLQQEEDALGRLSGAGVRQGARLDLAVKGLVAHTPRLLEETKVRAEQFRRFRTSADGLRDQAEALARRIEAFWAESQRRIQSFGGAQGAIHTIDQAAQQTRLLAVNAAIIAQQGGGGGGMQAIGVRLRGLADQTSQGAGDLERALDEHQLGIERESAGLWDLQEVAQRLGAGIQELLHVAGHLDQHGKDLERTLEAHAGLVEQVRQDSERAEQSLLDVSECSVAIRSALGHQWSVEAKAAIEVDQLFRTGRHMAEAGRELSQVSRKNVEEIWEILGGHQKLRQSEAYRQLASGDLARLLGPDGATDSTWNRTTWTRAQRHARLLGVGGRLQPLGRPDPAGGVRLLLLGLDALDRPEPSAVGAWSCDSDGRVWQLELIEGLRTEGHRLTLQEVIRESPLEACLPGTEVHVTPAGSELRLPFPYPGLPIFLGGLGLEMPVDSADWSAPIREVGTKVIPVQRLLWCGPDMDPAQRAGLMRLVHGWMRDDPQHESFMPWLPYEGSRPPCPWLAENEAGDFLEGRPKVHCLGLAADPTALHPLRDRLLQAGAEEGDGGAILCVARLGHDHPEALLLRLFQAGAGMADSPHPDLAPFRSRFHRDVLGGTDRNPYQAAWNILEDLQRTGWTIPLPSA
jgi:methyl-accepting chemotaxis protein